jgi:hypothetical protein
MTELTSGLRTGLATDLRRYYGYGRPIERLCYQLAGLMLLSGVAHLLVYGIDGGPWEGPVSWRKPVTFGLSFGITLASITWVATFVRLGARTRNWLLGLFAAACVAEVSLVTLQRWRGVPSHFNNETPLDTTITRILAAGGGIIVVTIVWLTVAALRPNPQTAPSMRIAVRVGLVTLLGALAIGGVMIATGMVSVYQGDRQAAYLHGGWLKPAHAALMHAVTVLPALAWLASHTDHPEDHRVRLAVLAAAGYLVAAVSVTVMTVVGISVVGAVCVALGAAALLTAGGLTVAGPVRRRVPDGIDHR